MTNAHAINSEIIEKEKEIKIRYDNEQKDLLIKLSKQERIMLNFMEQNIDIMIIEIIPKDDIDKTDKTKYFLIPKSNIKEESLLNKDIQIIQFPNGEDLSCSKGKITKIVNVKRGIPDTYEVFTTELNKKITNPYNLYYGADRKPITDNDTLVAAMNDAISKKQSFLQLIGEDAKNEQSTPEPKKEEPKKRGTKKRRTKKRRT